MGEQLKLGQELPEGRDSDGNNWVVKGNEVLIKLVNEGKYRFIGYLLDDSLIVFRDKAKHLMRKNNSYGFNYSVIEGLNIQRLTIYEPDSVVSFFIREWNSKLLIEKVGDFERQLFVPYEVIEASRINLYSTSPHSKRIALLREEWFHALKWEFNKEYLIKLSRYLAQRRAVANVFPSSDEMFRALQLCPISNTKIVIVGQDPYHTPDIADGLAFSSKQPLTIPPSLEKIYEGMEDDYGFGNFLEPDPSLEYLAEQGVLLLNRVLTVEQGNPMSHGYMGWKTFTDRVIQILDESKDNLVFMLWGAFAREVRPLIKKETHLIIECEHPAFAMRELRKWEHHNCFSKANKYLEATGQIGIRW